MGWRVRRSIRIAPGIRLNVGKRGVSTSIGGKGVTVNLSSRGTRTTVGVPGTGISHSSFKPARQRDRSAHAPAIVPVATDRGRSAGGGRMIGIGLAAAIGFAWLFSGAGGLPSQPSQPAPSEAVAAAPAQSLAPKLAAAATGSGVMLAASPASAAGPRSHRSHGQRVRHRGGHASFGSRGTTTGSCPCNGGNVCVGPRGGRYCITSGGRKRYGV